MAGERAHAAAIKAAIDDAPGELKAFDIDDLPDPVPAIHVLLYVSRRYGGTRRMSGGQTIKGWRLVTRVVGGTVDEARWALERVTARLEDQRVVIAGRATDLIRFETAEDIGPDDGAYSGAATWTYTH